MKKIITFLCLSFIVFFNASFVYAQNKNATTTKYSFTSFSQSKGQSLKSALGNAKITVFQKNLLLNIPIRRATKVKRNFRLAFINDKGKKLLREARISTKTSLINFVIIKTGGEYKFVSRKSAIKYPVKTVKPTNTKKETKKPTITLSSTKAVAKKPTKTVSSYSSQIYFIQQKGESLSNALKFAKLSPLQKSLILKLPITKNALSNRQFHIAFAKGNKFKTMKAVKVVRGNKSAQYVITIRNRAPVWSAKNTNINTKLSKLIKRPVNIKLEVPTKKVTVTNKGNYKLVSFVQKKGESIGKAMSRTKLSLLQRKLVLKMPVSKNALSNRKFQLLFKKESKRNLLKASKISRGNKKAEFVLIKLKGKLYWANKKGEVKGLTTTSKTKSSGFLRYPVRFSRISSRFNLRRRHPITRRIRPHKGVDFKTAYGARVYTPYGGVVTFAGRQRGYGRIVEVNHQNGYKTKYAHLSRINVRKGQRVRKGQTVGKAGNSGASTGTHLHYEVLVNGRARNPLYVRLPGQRKTVKSSTYKKSKEAIKLGRLYFPKFR